MQNKTVLFPITYKCNLNCKFCDVKDMRKVDIRKSMETLKKSQGIEWVYITGGEPFLIKQLPEICSELRDNNFKVGVTTNGTIFRKEICEVIDRLGISLDGAEEYHDAYRGKGTFKKAIELLKASKDKCETVIMSTYFSENEEALKKLKPIIEKINPNYWQIQRDINQPELAIPEF